MSLGFNYDKDEHDYTLIRRADPRIEQLVWDVLSDCESVLNIGAGAGSYEPPDKYVVAVEPSAVMRAKRTAAGKFPAVVATADSLPFDDNSFDATLASLTIHHWPDLMAGLTEMRRVTKKKMVILTYDPEQLDVFWNAQYFRPVVEAERRRYPKIDQLTGLFGARARVIEIPIPLDCTDGFQEAYYGRPEQFLRKEVRQAQSAWGFVDTAVQQQLVDTAVQQQLVDAFAEELKSGRWDQKFGHYRTTPFFTGAFRLVELNLEPS